MEKFFIILGFFLFIEAQASDDSALYAGLADCVKAGKISATEAGDLVAVAAGGQSRATLANRNVACLENQMPTKNGSYYQEEQAVLAKNLPPMSEEHVDAWTYIKATDFSQEKIEEIYAASAKYNIPPAVLFGAMAQESSMQEMGISKDFFNWACGMAQLNLNDWCEWANHSSPEMQKQIGWPKDDIDKLAAQHPKMNLCGTFFVVPEYVRPFYLAGMDHLQEDQPGAPEYKLEARHILADAPVFDKNMEYTLFKYTLRYRFSSDPAAFTTWQLKVRFEMAQSFALHCSDHKFGIPAGAYTFKLAFDALPDEIKNAQRYRSGERRKPDTCKYATESDYFPLSIGWLLADAVYNAGPELLPGVYEWQKKSGIPWDNFSPENLITAINYALDFHNTGLSAIGEKEARGHVAGVIEAVGATLGK